ncbi:MAG: glycosyltransferase [Sphingomonadales bacterium]|nr:glycosyltransferase [Sphingomonadales bacterium]
MTDAALARCRLMVATPIYEGAQGTYVRAALDLALRAQAIGLPVRFEFILYQPSITRARNTLTAMFLASDCTHMLFVDSDIDFAPDDIFSLIRAMDAKPECGVLGAAYPRRIINWHNVARAVEAGLAKDNPADLARYAGDFALHFLHPGQSFKMTDLVELSRLGTAMMLIRREVLEGMRTALPDLVFRPDLLERQAHGVGEIEPAFFCPLIEPESQALLSDDYAFCRRVRDAGYRIWLAPWVRTTHSGPMVFSGTLADTAQLYSVKPASSSE